jgi:hypothetical protein
MSNATSSVSGSLSGELHDAGNLSHSFSSVAHGQGALPQSSQSSGQSGKGAGGAGTTGGGAMAPPSFDFSFVHRGSESNIVIDLSQLPDKVNVSANAITAGRLYGYTAIQANGSQFCFIPYRQNEMPHLISTEEFQRNSPSTNPLPVSSAIPNAYQVRGSLPDDPSMTSIASAVVNPQRQYELAIPHAFVVIHLQPTQVTWLVNQNKSGESTYKFKKDDQ